MVLKQGGNRATLDVYMIYMCIKAVGAIQVSMSDIYVPQLQLRLIGAAMRYI